MMLLRRRSVDGFTLIELLVVITIIVVLLALLTPALDKAVYRAELLNCSAGNLNVMGKGVTTYAMSNKRYYPDRDITRRGYQEPGQLPINPQTIKRYSVQYDIRPLHSKIFSINKTLQCPFSPHIELEDYGTSSEDVGLDASYVMFWGWQYKDGATSFSGMYKYGNHFAYRDLDSNPNSAERVNRFNVLGGDIDLAWNTGAQASHPDKDGILSELKAEQEWFIERVSVGRWAGPHNRGTLDNNYVFDDGSIALYEGVTRVNLPWNNPNRDKRVARVPINMDNYNNRGNNVDKMQIPVR